jgi:hypothetical protein
MRPRQNKANSATGRKGPERQDCWWRGGAIMRNKANFADGRLAAGDNRAKRTQFATRRTGTSRTGRAKQSQSTRAGGTRPGGARGELCKTNPIWWSQMCETKPIFGGRDTPPFQSPRGRMGRGHRGGGRGQMCKTNPIRSGEVNVRNEPNLGWPGDHAKCAKRTQFSDCGLGTELRRDASWGLPAQGPVVQTNPIGRSELCKTKPICHPRRQDRRDRSYETKPISGEAGRDGAWGTRAVGCCTNKPNFRRAGRRPRGSSLAPGSSAPSQNSLASKAAGG